MVLNWKKEFLENQQRKIDELEAKLQKKDEVIAEIAEGNMLLKKLLVSADSVLQLGRFQKTFLQEEKKKDLRTEEKSFIMLI